MSLDKAIEFGKEKRKQFRKSKAFDRTCRNHGKCPWCEGNRTFQARKEHFRIQSLEKLEDSEEVPEPKKSNNYEIPPLWKLLRPETSETSEKLENSEYGPFQTY
jgi:hypothetical protein